MGTPALGSGVSACLFCRVIDGLYTQPKPISWFHKVLYENDDFLVIPALGPLCRGHVLMIPFACKGSMASVAAASAADPIGSLERFLERYNHLYPDALVLEHGTGLGGSTSCVEHAHWHILPGIFALEEWRSTATSFRSFAEFARGESGDDSYLLSIEPGERVLARRQQTDPCQYFRRQISAELGSPDTWDYLVHPKYEIIRQTLADFSNVTGSS